MPPRAPRNGPLSGGRGLPTPQGTVAGTVFGGSLLDDDSASDSDVAMGGNGGGVLSDDDESDVEMTDGSSNGDGANPNGSHNHGVRGNGRGGGGGSGDDSSSSSSSSDAGNGEGSGNGSDDDEANDADQSDNGSEDGVQSEDESDDDDDDDDIPAPPGVDPQEYFSQHPECVILLRVLKTRGNNYRRQLDDEKLENANLKATIKILEDRIKKLEDKKKKTWQEAVRAQTQKFQETHEAPTMAEWETVCKHSNKEENMSTVAGKIHPDIELVGPGDDRRPELVDKYTRYQPKVPMIGDRPLDFLRLPLHVQATIFRLWLSKEGQLIHCMSRLDPFVCPARFPSEEELNGNSGLPTRFYWGPRYFNLLKDGQKPNDTLRLLLVSRYFHYMGTHCFYATNTFAFSSLGELFRFMNGIGPARLDRIQHLEVTWIGNQYITAPPPPEPGKPSPFFSVRTHALCWLPEGHRLRTLVFHINETGKEYIRRRYESAEHRRWMAAKTRGQPNYRQTRSLRTIQGMDFIYTLRGMSWIRFYDYEKALKPQPNQVSTRVPIHDWSFHEDISNVTTMDKVPIRKEHAKLENLAPFFKPREEGQPQPWEPTAEHLELVKDFYNEYQGQGAYDMLRQNPLYQDLDFSSRIGTDAPQTNASRSGSTASTARPDDIDSGDDSPGPGFGPGGGGHDSDTSTPPSDSESEGDLAPGSHLQPIDLSAASDSDTDMEDAESMSFSVAGSVHNPISIDSSDDDESDEDDKSGLFVQQPRGQSHFASFLRSQAAVWQDGRLGSAKSEE